MFNFRCSKLAIALLFVTLSHPLASAEDWKEYDLQKLLQTLQPDNKVAAASLGQQLYIGYCYAKQAEAEVDEKKIPAGVALEASLLWVEDFKGTTDRITHKGRASFGGELDQVKEKNTHFDFLDQQAGLLKQDAPYIVFDAKENQWILKNNAISVDFLNGDLHQVDEFLVFWQAKQTDRTQGLVATWTRVYRNLQTDGITKTEVLGYCHYPSTLKF